MKEVIKGAIALAFVLGAYFTGKSVGESTPTDREQKLVGHIDSSDAVIARLQDSLTRLEQHMKEKEVNLPKILVEKKK